MIDFKSTEFKSESEFSRKSLQNVIVGLRLIIEQKDKKIEELERTIEQFAGIKKIIEEIKRL